MAKLRTRRSEGSTAVRRGGALALLLLCACVTDKVTGEKRFAIQQWSVQEEQSLGDKAAPDFEQQYDGSFPDRDAQQYLGGLVKEMATHSVRKDDFPWQFEILDSSEPNAFALPGGYVYVTRGLLVNLESEGEFVAVLGHELGHVEHQHAMLQQNKQLLAGLFLGAVGLGEDALQKDPDKPHYVTALASGLTPLALLHFSREQESEADQRGVYFSHAMGYDPREMKKTFAYFDRLEKQSGSSTPSFLRDHPMNADRIHDIDQEIALRYSDVLAKAPETFRSPPGAGDRFVRLVQALKAREPSYRKHDQARRLLAKSSDDAKSIEQARQLVDAARKELPDEPLFAITAGEIEYAAGKGDRGRSAFEKALAQERPAAGHGHWKPPFYLGALDVDGRRGASAVASLRSAQKLYPSNPLSAYYLGRAEELNGDPRAAAAAYSQVLKLSTPESQLYKKSSERLQSLQGGTPSRR